MKNLLQTLLCFVFVGQCLSQLQSYGRQRTIRRNPRPIIHPKPVVPKLIHPKPVVNPMPFGGSNSGQGQGGGMFSQGGGMDTSVFGHGGQGGGMDTSVFRQGGQGGAMDTSVFGHGGQGGGMDTSVSGQGGGMFPQGGKMDTSAFGQGGLMNLQGGGVDQDPFRNMNDVVFEAGDVVGGVTLPRHGGVLNENGLGANGFGAVNPNGPPTDGWSDPLDGNAYPSGYDGRELIYDQVLGRYIYLNKGGVGHQATGTVGGGVIGVGVDQMSHNNVKSGMAVEHSIMKEAGHIAKKTVAGVPAVSGGMSVDPMSHNFIKSSSSGTIMAGKPKYDRGVIKAGGVDPVSHIIFKNTGERGIGVNPFSHNMGKASVAQSGMIGSQFGADPIVHGIVKSTSVGTGRFNQNGGMSQFINGQPIGAGGGKFQHNMVKSSVGGGQKKQGSHINFQADAQMAHNFDKSGGGTFGMPQFAVGQTGMVGNQFVADPIVHDSAKSASVGTGGFTHNIAKEGQFQHDIVKSSVGGGNMNRQADAQMAHNFDKSGGGTFGMPQFAVGQTDMFGNQFVADPIVHDSAKSASVGTGGFTHNIAKEGQFQHNMVKSSVGGGTMNRQADAQMAHNVDKSGGSSIGMDQFGFRQQFGAGGGQFQHDVVKSSVVGGGHIAAGKPKFASTFGAGVSTGTSFINQGSHINRKDAQMTHNFDKSGGSTIGMVPFGQINQGPFGIGQPIGSSGQINQAQFGMGQPIGTSVVHNVNKVGEVGAVSIGHDRLASEVGHGLAKSSIADSASIVDMGSGGAVSMGDPFANLAAARLAQESLHVAQKTVGMATNGGGQLMQPVMKQPTMPKKPFVVQTGYGGRTRVRVH